MKKSVQAENEKDQTQQQPRNQRCNFHTLSV
jgi:hypothetical protein